MQRREQRKGSEVAEVKRALSHKRQKRQRVREEERGSDKGRRRRECSALCEMISGGAKARGARE